MPIPEQSLVNVRPFVQPVLTALLIAAVVWVVNTTDTNNDNLSVLTVRVEYLTTETSEIKDLIEGRPTAESFRYLTEKVNDLNGEITRIHAKINAFVVGIKK